MDRGMGVPRVAVPRVSVPRVAAPQVGSLRVAVIGAGDAGRWFARLGLRSGLEVTLEDVLPTKLRRAAEEMGADGRLRLAASIEEAVRDADVAIDFVPDELESKLEIFSLLDRMAPPRTVLLTPTEALSVADLASCTYRGERCFGLRGLAGEGAAEVRLAHPAVVDAEALEMVGAMLGRMGFRVAVGVDAMASGLAGR